MTYNYINNLQSNKLEKSIEETVKVVFPKLKKSDLNLLIDYTKQLVDFISDFYFFDINNEDYEQQWLQNNNRDIKSALLLLLPYINDKENGYLLRELTDLKSIYLPDKLLQDTNNYSNFDIVRKMELNLLINEYFKYSNINIALFYDQNKIKKFIETFDIKIIIENNYNEIINTLNIVGHKQYINWINFVPITLENYKETKIYNNNQFDSSNYYNILRSNLYEHIKKIKWLIFPYQDNNNKLYIVQGLTKMLQLKNIINNKFYYQLDTNDQTNFKNQLYLLYQNILKNEYIFSKLIDEYILKYTLIYFISNNSFDFDISILNDFKIINDDDEDKDEDFKKEYLYKMNNITLNQINVAIKFIIDTNSKYNLVGYLYDYLKDSITKLRYSSYGLYLFENTIIKDNYYYYSDSLNLKNIYNIAKSFSHDDNWEKLGDTYLCLSNNEKIQIKNRIDDLTKNNFIKINQNLKRQYLNATNIDYNDLSKQIINEFDKIKTDLIFEQLIYNGLLSEFRPNIKMTDKNLFIGKSNNEIKEERKKLMKEYIKENKNIWNKAYYYNNNTQFEKMDKIRKDNKDIDYLDYVAEESEWCFFFAMDWIGTIGFYNNYINNQVLYITGATGQGKSTQVPKLLLYSLKMINFQNNSTILCSQPRIAPTTNNAIRIAKELGLMIEYNKNSQNIKTNNYTVQYKYQEGEHTTNNNICNTLKIETDGTLFETLKNENAVYDIVIVDEAHEHNTYMDLILTIMKHKFDDINFTKKLVIISATMEDDEPKYRLFFKKQHQLDIDNNCFIESRYHISPPGETTQYTINEYYETHSETYSNNHSNNNFCNYDENILNSQTMINEDAQRIHKLGEQKILELCKKTSSGDILFFCIGENDIKKSIEYLNSHPDLPSECIALPYYSKLHSNYRGLIEKIDTKISTITINRNEVYKQWGEEYKESKGNNKYKRAIILATNVAEASITISSLKYVIDNGYAKVKKFNKNNNTETLSIESISESSRLQRKGRVGRTNDGDVYYLYPKDCKKKIKSKFKITQDNLTDIMFKLLNIYSSKELIDNDGSFYLIHPCENTTTRNLFYNSDVTFRNDYYYIFNNLLSQFLITHDYNQLYKTQYEDVTFKVSELGKAVLEFKSSNNINETILYISSYNMNCFSTIFEINILLNIIPDNNIQNLYISSFKSNSQSDLIDIYNIIKRFKQQFNHLLVFNLTTNKLKSLLKMHKYIIYDLINMKKQKNHKIISDINLYNKFSSLYNNYNSEKEYWNFHNDIDIENNAFFKLIISSKKFKESISNDINNNIDKWCYENNINNIIFREFLLKLINSYCNFDILNFDLFIEKHHLDINLIKYLTTNTIEEKIIRAYMYAYPNNIAFNGNDNNMITIINNNKNIVNIDSSISYSNIIFYLYKKESNNSDILDVSIISNIDIRWLVSTNPLYFNSSIFYSNYITVNKEIEYYFYTNFYNKMREVIYNNSNYNNMIWLSQEYRPELTLFLNKMNKIIN
jgi:hypothetical protein